MTRILALVISCIFFLSCDKSKHGVPAYLHIDKISFNPETTDITNPKAMGTAEINDAWIYINDQAIGVFELPCTVPILKDEAANVLIAPGIKFNGISSTRGAYRYYKNFEQRAVSFSALDTTVVTPVVSYNNAAGFPFAENFENINSVQFDTIFSNSALGQELVNMESYGKYAGKISLTTDKPGFKMLTNKKIFAGNNTGYVMLEMNYKNDVPFILSIVVYPPTNPAGLERTFYVAKPTAQNADGENQWNKIYLELTPLLLSYVNTNGFKLGVTANIGSNSTSVKQGTILIDNFKVVYN